MVKDIDYALVLQVLYSEGYTLADIGRKTGAPLSTLSTVKQELKSVPEAWHNSWEGIALQDYYFKAMGTPAPYVGDFIEVRGECYGN